MEPDLFKFQERLAVSTADEPTTSPRSRAPPNTLGPFFISRMEEFNIQVNIISGSHTVPRKLALSVHQKSNLTTPYCLELPLGPFINDVTQRGVGGR